MFQIITKLKITINQAKSKEELVTEVLVYQ